VREDSGDDPIHSDWSPIRHTLSGAALLLVGAAAGVVGMKFWAPQWMAAPWSASGFYHALIATQPPATQPAPGTNPMTASAPVTTAAPLTAAQPVTAKPQAAASAPAAKPVPSSTTTPASPGPASTARVTPAPAPAPQSNPFATPDEENRRRHLHSQLMTCRAQIELYKLQHNDHLPDFAKYPAWHQMTHRTRADGTVADDAEFGPYLKAAPVNPLNGLGGIGLSRGEPRAGQLMKAEKLGYVICVTNGAIYATERDGKTIASDGGANAAALAAAASSTTTAAGAPATQAPSLPAPHPMAGTPQERGEALNSQLQMLRTEIELYKLQHVDLPPDFVHYPYWEQMVRKTRSDGAFDGKGFGPYLDRRPINPTNGFTKIECVQRITFDFKLQGQQVGYIFETSSGRLLATDDEGGIWRE
jgi:hypothetical protein